MTEYIEREALYEKAYWHGEHPDVGNPFPDGVDAIDIKDVDAIPAADVAPVVHGYWEIVLGSNGKEYMVCTCCRVSQDLTGVFTYCPSCGARMDGGSENG